MLDTIERLARRGHPVTVYVSPPESVEAFRTLLSLPLLSFVPQQGDTLGDRMLNAFLDAHSQSLLPAIMTGTDSPTLPDTVLDTAVQALASGTRAVLGPACDGGFYLIGLADVHPEYFFGSDYSNTTVFTRTWQAIRQRSPSSVALPEWYDIDDSDGMRRLIAEPELQRIAPRTAEVIKELIQSSILANNGYSTT